jgi:predicted HTH transcriptional regulator
MLEWKYQTGNDVLFESTVDKTKFTFMLDTETAKSGMETKESGINITESITDNITEDQKNITESVTEKLTNNQKKIIENIVINPYITSEELSVIVGIAPVNIRVNIKTLKKKGIIRREGADRGGKWIILKQI